jgi:hypothetical protein
VVVGVAVGFVVVVGLGAVVAVEPGTAVVDGPPTVVVVVDSADASPVEEVPSPGATAVVTVVVVAVVPVVPVVRPACSVDFDPCEDAPATPTDMTAVQMRICVQRGKFRNRFQRFMLDGKGPA